MKPRVAFKTIGCRLNQAETARMTAQFTAAGYAVVPFGEACDAAVIHGCLVTKNAERDSLHAARSAKRATPGCVVVLAGCPAEVLGATPSEQPVGGDPPIADPVAVAARGCGSYKEGHTLPTGASFDLLVGQADKFSIPELLHRHDPQRFPHPRAACKDMETTPQFQTTRALVKVQDGCDFRCAYCIVPAARGGPKSRPFEEILDEVERIGHAGFKEVVLTGANLGCYGDRSRTLADLVRRMEDMPAIQRIRLSSIEITTAERAIIDHMARSAKLCHFLHIPMQSGDDRILAAMGRRYTRAEYRKTLEYAAEQVPQIGLGADVMVGFPGEDDPAFAHTVELIEALPFSNLHVFPYSPRPGTRAERMPHQVPDAVKRERVRALLEIAKRKRTEFARQFIGRTVSVLIERIDDHGQGRGWTGEYLEAEVTGTGLAVNQIVTVAATEATAGKLFGVRDIVAAYAEAGGGSTACR